MFTLIPDEQFAAAAIDTKYPESVNEELLAEEPGGGYLRKFLLLTYFPERFGAQDNINTYYNKYYWFLKFYQAYQITHGSNMSMEQQAFKVMEEGEYHEDTDWDVVESIAREFE